MNFFKTTKQKLMLSQMPIDMYKFLDLSDGSEEKELVSLLLSINEIKNLLDEIFVYVGAKDKARDNKGEIRFYSLLGKIKFNFRFRNIGSLISEFNSKFKFFNFNCLKYNTKFNCNLEHDSVIELNLKTIEYSTCVKVLRIIQRIQGDIGKTHINKFPNSVFYQ